MAWLESHQTLARHPKTRKAARLLGIGVPAMIGHLHLVWYWALDYAQDGDVSAYEPADIAEAAMWAGDPDVFMSALIKCGVKGTGFITSDLQIHEWMDYAGKVIVQRKADAERKRNSRLKLDDTSVSSGHPADGGRTADVPHPTIPNTTEPNSTVPNTRLSVNARASFDEWFNQFWELYPPNSDGIRPRKPDAIKAAEKVRIEDRPKVLQAVANYARCDAVQRGAVKYPQGFLNPTYWPDYLEVKAGGSNGRYPNGNNAGTAKSRATEAALREEMDYRARRQGSGDYLEGAVGG